MAVEPVEIGDAERLARLTSAINRLALLEFDIMQRYATKLDRAVISGERLTLAGDFDRSIASLVQEGGGVLPELGREFAIVLRSIDAGADTDATLKALSDLLEVEELSSVLSVLRQVDRFGGEVREPLLETLAVLEERRSLTLREKVNHLSGRMTVVMVLFFFPALLIFVAGPAFMSIIKALGDVAG